MAKPNTIKYKPAYADTFTLKAFKTKDLVIVSPFAVIILRK